MIAIYSGIITLLTTATLALLFAFLYSRTGPERPAAEVSAKVYAVRNKYFWAILVVLLGLLGWTLTKMPFPELQAKEPTMHVTAIARQWSWQMINGAYKPDMMKSKAADSIVIPAGATVQFHVASDDVNHGFGIYDPEGRLVAQVQVMPKYVNRVMYTFDKPGIYQILCMEYCGVAHHIMTTLVQVEGS